MLVLESETRSCAVYSRSETETNGEKLLNSSSRAYWRNQQVTVSTGNNLSSSIQVYTDVHPHAENRGYCEVYIK